VVGIVVVAHSRALARAAVALAEEMLTGPGVAIVVAAGLDEETFGTDAVQIQEALVEADDGDGVVVLMDLGSAVLSAELALELLDDDEARERVLLCPAPLVEGLVVAAVTAASGAGRAEVAAEALGALAGKQSQLAPTMGGPTSSVTAAATGTFTLTPAHGLHARPAARVVQVLQGLNAQVELRNRTTGSDWVPGASLSRLATLGAQHGHQVDVRADGPQAAAAIEQLQALAGRNFDENPSLPAMDESNRDGPLPASPGIGIGPAITPDLDPELPSPRAMSSPAEERQRLATAIDAVRAHLHQVRARVAAETSAAEAGIFDAHLALLADPDLAAVARAGIETGQSAEAAWAGAVSRAAAGLEALPDAYLSSRAADIHAVGEQVRRQLLTSDQKPTDAASGVLVAADLTPDEAATLNPDRVAAVVLAFGSPTAHSAILARARGIPTVVAAGPAVLEIAEGTVLAVDGSTGELAVDPSPEVLERFRERARVISDRDQQARARADTPALTRAGVRVLVGANVGSVADARAAATAGADLVGLVRTEFLFLGRDRPPDVAEQEAVYRAIAAEIPGRRITFRTLDVGGDKPLRYLPQPTEANPFLGVRGLRLSLRHPDLLADQLLAIVRVAHDVPVSVMFPMVSTVDELRRARVVLSEAITRAGRGEPAGLQIGIMVEVPAAALKAAEFADQVDFFSIGTNDLTQYTLAAERGNPAVAALADPLDPAVLRLIEATCRGAGPGTTVAVCGELAADAAAVAVLVGLGVRELSVTPSAVALIKQAVREL
jgi:phosphoenolpyruvate-protein phosphotransferase/dihydroxyacetone kinase phosphotransfer subunit